MKLRQSWSPLLLLVTLTASFAGACSATKGNSFTTATTNGAGGGSPSTGPSSPAGSGGTPQLVSTGVGAADGGPPPPTTCDASCVPAGGQCQMGTCVITDNPGGVAPGTQTMLEAGGSPNPAFTWLYPYDQTVFPRGLLPPTMQLGNGGVDGAYVHVSFPGFDYKGFFGASAPPRIALSAAVWNTLTLSATGLADVKVEVTEIAGGQVHGPVTETWTIAKGSLRGTIYYETYGSTILGGLASVGLMKIQPGATVPTIVKSGCGNVCHTASADGSTLVAATFLGSSASYDLKNNAATIWAEPSNHFTYGALCPDGSVAISATNYRTWFPDASRMYDTKTGAVIPAPGWDGVINTPGTPAFSPDGTKIAFNHFDADPSGGLLSMMNVNLATRTFTGLVDIANAPGTTVAWPAFLPDTTGVVYHAGSNNEFETDSGATGDVFWTDVATHTVHRLDALDGYTPGGQSSYLPANDPHLSFAPTVLPEAVGGYFWVVFTSHRSYGNTLPTQDNGDQNGKLWVAAFDIGGTAGTDPSHPAFYLDGQESGADNLRGFWVLNPCKADGSDCASGDECCAGFCTANDGGMGQCTPMSSGCSQEFEKCTKAADCCNTGDKCINGKCATLPPQ